MNPAQRALLVTVHVYRWTVSPLLRALFGVACRFEPSCSQYALDAVRHHGAGHGGWLALRRLLRCHPWGGCGCDPVPTANGNGQALPEMESRGTPPAMPHGTH